MTPKDMAHDMIHDDPAPTPAELFDVPASESDEETEADK